MTGSLAVQRNKSKQFLLIGSSQILAGVFNIRTYSSLSSRWCSSSDWQNLMTVIFWSPSTKCDQIIMNCNGTLLLISFCDFVGPLPCPSGVFLLPQAVFKSLNNWTSQCNHLCITYRGCWRSFNTRVIGNHIDAHGIIWKASLKKRFLHCTQRNL